MTARRNQGTPGMLPELPPISALFLIDFDVKAGYTIIWKQAVPGLELEGLVEYKSLPSGLHTVPDDLIYFVHEEGYAGLSAFINAPTDDEGARHARMIAVGVLVPLSYGRLGKAWRHAEGLKDMAARLAIDRKQTQLLDEYWDKCGTREPGRHLDLAAIKDSPLPSPALTFANPRQGQGEHARNRSASEGIALASPGHALSPFHPAWSLTKLLDTFGPLIFPIHRAALLRKRLLISAHAPVHEMCNFVYDISILANIPLSVFDLLDPSAPSQRLRPLFTIGVHDIPFLMADHSHPAASKRPATTSEQHSTPLGDSGSGWIACTTDSIIAMKDDLWDVLITMPPPHAANANEKVWPTVEAPKGVPVKATQRDLRRFRTLKVALRRLAAAGSVVDDNEGDGSSENNDTARPTNSTRRQSRLSMSSIRTNTFITDGDDSHIMADAAEKLVEPMTWAALAYSGFMWWASAGEQRRSDEAEEQTHDTSLIADLLPAPTMHQPAPSQQQQQQQRRPSGSFNVTAVQDGMRDSMTSLTARRTTTVDGLIPMCGDSEEEERARTELAIITYFHRLTAGILSTLAEVVDAAEEDEWLPPGDVRREGGEGRGGGEDEEESDQLLPDGGRSDNEEDAVTRSPVRVDSDALVAMGLDIWSDGDAEFVRQAVSRYFNREAKVEGKRLELCGLRVC
ncbi:Protein LCHN [Cytospora mali]|uniref:Protein LCHN n=1 Tax=Cytospora mali TaxID=578113 RepID=A0A194UZ71_CYTMA|nr:Protein LCHN [Valsa mali var. pyri (nom. inval.)]